MSLFRSILGMAAMAAMLMGGPAAGNAAEDAGAAPVVRVVFNTDPNPPLVYGSGTAIDPDRPGLIVDMLHMVESRTGIRFHFQRIPWQRGLYMVEYGQADAIFAASFTPERTRFGVFPMRDGQVDESRKIYQLAYSLFVRQDSAVKWTGRDITGLQRPVGATPAFAVVPLLQQMGVPLDQEASVVGNLRKLRDGRIDAYAEIDTLAEAAMHANPAESHGIVKLTPPLRSTPYFLMFAKSFDDAHPGVAARVWDAIAAVRASPAYRALLVDKYADSMR